jgi:hypothetical protein
VSNQKALLVVLTGVALWTVPDAARANYQCPGVPNPTWHAQVCSVTAPGSASTGQTINVSWTSRNQQIYRVGLCYAVGASTFCNAPNGVVLKEGFGSTTSASVTIPACVPNGAPNSFRISVEVAGPATTGDTALSSLMSVSVGAPCVSNVQVEESNLGQGELQIVTWSASGQQSYTLFLYNADGSTPVDTTSYFPGGGPNGFIKSQAYSGGDASFFVPATFVPQTTLPPGQYKVRVRATGAGGQHGEANSPTFTVTATPGVGNVAVAPVPVQQGGTTNITWASRNQAFYVLELWNGSGPGRVADIASGPGGATSYAWTVPMSVAAGSYRVKARVRIGSAGPWAEAFSVPFTISQRPTITIRFATENQTVGEGWGSTTPMVTVDTSNNLPTQEAVSVPLFYNAGSPPATRGADYQTTGDTLFIPQNTFDGQQVPIPTINILQDALSEDDERFSVQLSTAVPPHVVIASPVQHDVTIADDDPLPVLRVSSDCGVVDEGQAGHAPCFLRVSLSPEAGRDVFVQYAHSGTALPVEDWTGTPSGVLSFGPGTTERTVPRHIVGDIRNELDETLDAALFGELNATVAVRTANVIVRNDDPEPTISVSDCTVVEGTGSPTSCTFTVSLSAASGRTVTVDYATANDTATSPADYASTSGTLTFPPDTPSRTVAVGVVGDAMDEFDERAFLNLTAPGNGVLGDSQGQLTIVDDDEAPTVSIGDCSRGEGHLGQVACDFEVSLSGASGKVVTVPYGTGGGVGTYPAAPDVDFVPRSGSLVFPPGTATTQRVPVFLVGDLLDEFDETYAVGLGTPTNATLLDSQAVGTIEDDDLPPRVSLQDCSVPEGHVGYAGCVVTATLDAPSGKPIRLDLVSADDVAGPNRATLFTDYSPRTHRLVFEPGTTSLTGRFPVRGDRLFEAAETFRVDALNRENVDVEDDRAIVTITNDDAPGFSMEDLGVVEGGVARFVVTLSPKPATPASVAYGTADGTATVADGDFTPTFGTLTFGPETSRSLIVDVPVAALGGVEGPQTFRMVLSNPDGAPIGHGEATATIVEPAAGRSFDADLTTDLLWRHAATGDLAVWFMDDLVLTGGTPTDPPGLSDLGWSVVGTGDVNRDGQADLVWSHQSSPALAFWLMDGVRLVDGASLPAPTDLAWRIVGTGDFDRDESTDLLWRHSGSNQLAIWHLDGVTLRDGILVTEPGTGWPDSGWVAAGTGDFNRDGGTDVLWRNTVSGQLAVWYLDDHEFLGGELLDPMAMPDLDWELQGTRDLDRDGRPDLLWRHRLSGELVAWLMDGIVMREGRFLTPPGLGDLGWRLVGPR